MPRLTVDAIPVEVEDGATVLDAARKAGVEIPTLCHVPSLEPSVSCMVCVVRIEGMKRLAPSCAMPAAEGMVIVTNDEEIASARRDAVELLLSHHTGDCAGPCELACPAQWPIARMLRAMQRGETNRAAHLATLGIALPRTLGHVCPAPCEKACRRGRHDDPLAIRSLHRYAATHTKNLSLPAGPATRKRIAIIGAGPAGLAAALTLRILGYDCTLLEQADRCGGGLRELEETSLPADALTADVEAIVSLGITLRTDSCLTNADDLTRMGVKYDAVILATGAAETNNALGLTMTEHGVRVDDKTMMTSREGVFAAGGCVRSIRAMSIRAIAQGQAAARGLDAYLNTAAAPTRPYRHRLGGLRAGEMKTLLAEAKTATPRHDKVQGNDDASNEAGRCLHCDCRAATDCRLRTVAETVNADGKTYTLDRPDLSQDRSHPTVVYEPGKCIACGHCVRIAARYGEQAGPAFLGRGFEMRIEPPAGRPLAEGLQKAATDCVQACPTGALAWIDEEHTE